MAGRIWRSLRIVSRVVSRRSRSASNSFSDIDADQVWCNIAIISGNQVRCASPEAIGLLVNTFMKVVYAVSPHASQVSAPGDCTAPPCGSPALALRRARTTGARRPKGTGHGDEHTPVVADATDRAASDVSSGR